MKKTVILDIVCSLLILLFLYTGFFKLITFNDFRAMIYKSPLIHKSANYVAIAVIISELTIGSLLLASFFSANSIYRKWGLIGSTALMILFTLYVFYMIQFAPGLPCTCGGIIQQMNWHQHLYFNITYSIMAIIGVFINAKYNKNNTKSNLQYLKS